MLIKTLFIAKMPTITVGIPCYKPHLLKLQRLLDSLEAQTRKPDEVIVSTSSSLPEDIPKLPTYLFPVILIVDYKSRKAAENRNNCFRLARCDIVYVIDADDVCHKQHVSSGFSGFESLLEERALLWLYVVFEPYFKQWERIVWVDAVSYPNG
jgi:glycosyltransferase involved in cell wall biosynthesis